MFTFQWEFNGNSTQSEFFTLSVFIAIFDLHCIVKYLRSQK
jgi:hypothetical protein